MKVEIFCCLAIEVKLHIHNLKNTNPRVPLQFAYIAVCKCFKVELLTTFREIFSYFTLFFRLIIVQNILSQYDSNGDDIGPIHVIM